MSEINGGGTMPTMKRRSPPIPELNPGPSQVQNPTRAHLQQNQLLSFGFEGVCHLGWITLLDEPVWRRPGLVY
ncbi:hypothetical protein BDV06DRAFT_156339 [Aspergillus oleicola]